MLFCNYGVDMEHYIENYKNQANEKEFWRGFRDGLFSCTSFNVPMRPKQAVLNSKNDVGLDGYWKAVGGYLTQSIDKYAKEEKRPSA